MNYGPNQGFGPFEAFSIKPNGMYLRTFHRTARSAARRLNGNPRHTGHKLIDHRPVDPDGTRRWVWLQPPAKAPAKPVEA
jgi:hypothetical protein